LLAVDETSTKEVDLFAFAVSDFVLIPGCSDDIIIPKNPDIYFILFKVKINIVKCLMS
jgi:hypothetical protein